ncbi:MAG: DMT family transporter [Atopobiaceae bacterium]|nr:DMT family transporter [Atopobiaceae bacterium]MDY5275987.1 DMT family transporter [Atopobiaceae bacterium]
MAEEKGARQSLAAFEMLLGGASYGFMATTYKLAYAAGYSWQEVVAAQAWTGCGLFVLLALIEALRGTKLVRLPLREAAKLMGLGALSAVTSSFYCFSMTRLEASVALTLLFQYSWLGIPVQLVLDGRKPTRREAISAALIVAATPMASGVWRHGLSGLDPAGVAAALVAALSCATFLVLSGRVSPACGTGERGTLICLGLGLASLLVCPAYIPSGVFFSGMAPFALMAGLFGMFLPVLLFGLGGPHLSAASATVLASAELPAGLFVSALVLKDSTEPLQWAAVALILGAIAFSQYQGKEHGSRRRTIQEV